MRLARIEHERCGEVDHYTYVWVPMAWSSEEFESAVDRAADAYLKFAQSWKDEPAPNSATPHSSPKYAEHPTLMVQEIEVNHAQAKAVYKAWEDGRKQAKKKFVDYLVVEGLLPFWDNEPDLSTTVFWGHNHGLGLNYGCPEPNSKDLPGPGTNIPLRKRRISGTK